MNEAEGLLTQLKHLSCWGLQWGRQTNLSLSFGKPHLRVIEPKVSKSRFPSVRRRLAQRLVIPRGEYWLWFHLAFWRIELADGSRTTGSASRRRIDDALDQLSGQKLVGWRVSARNGATTMDFDLGASLSARRMSVEPDAPVWTLYMPRGWCFSVDGTGQFSRNRSHARQRWRELSGEGATDSR
jgi:hypothetical protein